jgi:hypothetical protein
MSDVVSVDLSPVVRALSVVNDNLALVGQEVHAVAQEQVITRGRLEQLCLDFAAFVTADQLQKELHLAETRRVKVRQELEQSFGHHVEVRRRVTGILQASDLAIVRQETLRTTTEELMVAAPGYWLAPTLIALTAWIGDRRELAERALAEALRRDLAKTSLLFALVCRRASRFEALVRWLAQYFQAQDPQALDREVVIMLNAVASGVFGGAAREECLRVCGQWIAELELQGGFLDDQRRRWIAALDGMTPKIGPTEFPTLRQYSPTWPRLEAALAVAHRNGAVAGYFRQLFDGELVPPPHLAKAVDEILDRLVSQFDDEELPLRREERLLALIVETHGDRPEAERRMKAEATAFDEEVPFTGVLTNAAMHSQSSQASRATQRYAVSLSREWILMAHQDMLARDRAAVPEEAEIKLGDWSAASKDGSNEAELVEGLSRHREAKERVALAGVGMGCLAWAGIAIAAIATIVLLTSLVSGKFAAAALTLVFGLGAAGLYLADSKLREKKLAALRQQLAQERDQALAVLRACLAELADLRRAWAKADSEASSIADALMAARSEQQVLRRPDEARTVLS